MPSTFKRYRVVYTPVSESMTCWRQSRDEAEEYARGVLEGRGVEYTELWAVEEPEAWSKLWGGEGTA